MGAFAIGVDLGGTNMRVAAIDQNGKQLETITTGTEVKRGRDSVINEMCQAIQSLAAKFHDSHKLVGIGIGVPGIIEMEKGTIRQAPNLPGWGDYPVKREIEERLGTTVFLENDANAATLGEKWLGAARDFDAVALMTLGTGVGGGIVVDGRIWHGMSGMAGEMGHMTVYPDGVICGCSNRGCLEQYASASAIKRMALEAISTGKAPELARAMSENPEFSAKIVYQLATQGDLQAQEIFNKVGQALGIAMASLINIFNFPMYVLGGGAASAWDAFAPAMFKELTWRSVVYRSVAMDSEPGHKKTIITNALLGSDAGLVGAARLPLQAAGL